MIKEQQNMSTSEPIFKQLGIKTLFLVWGAPHGSHRTQLMADHLGMDVKHIHIIARQGIFYAPFKYTYQFFATLFFLMRHRYQLIFIQSPPIFAVLPVYVYSLFSSARFVIDAHTRSVHGPPWEWTAPLHRFLSRRAITTIVTNIYLQKMIADWDACGFVLQDPPIDDPHINQPMQLESDAINVVMVSSASPDEPVKEVIESARSLPEMHFYITGNHTRSNKFLIDSAPPNVHFTGYLRDEFFPLLHAVDIIMDLCNEEYQFLSGANEALWLGKPLITTKAPVRETYFNRGTIHVDNTAEGIGQGLREMKDRLAEMSADMRSLQDIRRHEWWEKINNLAHLIKRIDI